MKELIKKNWEYTLYLLDEKHILSVLCGTVALFERNIILTDEELKNFYAKGEPFIDLLAEKIRSTPNIFSSRHIELPFKR